MKIRVTVRDKQIVVECGEGTQTLKWLANAALCRYDSSYGVSYGYPRGVRLEDGTTLPLSGIIKDRLEANDSIFVMLSHDGDGAGSSSPARSRDREASPDGKRLAITAPSLAGAAATAVDGQATEQ